jgi:hypothetical protein
LLDQRLEGFPDPGGPGEAILKAGYLLDARDGVVNLDQALGGPAGG